MKTTVISLALVSILFLVACGKSNSESAATSQVSRSEETETKETSTSQEPTSDVLGKSAETDVTFNGSYYSVQGKYDQIIVVNKKHPLSATYAPEEDPTALAAFQTLVADMQAQGFAVSNAYSGFRSYETQSTLYNTYVASDNQENADRYCARPGYSEHQTGLAFDLLDSSGQLLTEESAAIWLANHAHDYGFILRYLPDKEYSTGYMPESWHIRYIGKEATAIYQSGLSLEDYLGLAGGDYED